MEGMSSVRRDLRVRSPKLGGWGSACCTVLLVCRMKVCSSVNLWRRGGSEGWCVTMTVTVGVLLRFALHRL